MKIVYEKYYIDSLLYLLKYNKNYLSVKWYNSDDIGIVERKKESDPKKDNSNIFLQNYDTSNLLAEDIIKNGFYFPVITCLDKNKSLIAMCGSHRINSLHRNKTNLKVMCIDINHDYIIGDQASNLFKANPFIETYVDIFTTTKNDKSKLIKINTNDNQTILRSTTRLSKHLNTFIKNKSCKPHLFFNNEELWLEFYNNSKIGE